MGKPKNVIGPQIRRWRDQHDLTQTEFAAMLQRGGWDVARDTIQRIEQQSRWVADFELIILASVMREPLDFLVSRCTFAQACQMADRLA